MAAHHLGSRPTRSIAAAHPHRDGVRKPEEMAIHIGRSRRAHRDRSLSDRHRLADAVQSPRAVLQQQACGQLRGLGETDWKRLTPKHQVHPELRLEIPRGAPRRDPLREACDVRGRFDNGAKLVTFDVRLSNTAGRSDGSGGHRTPAAKALLGPRDGQRIVAAGEHDRVFLEEWVMSVRPKARSGCSRTTRSSGRRSDAGIPAGRHPPHGAGVRARPAACVAFTNRGSSAALQRFLQRPCGDAAQRDSGQHRPDPAGYCLQRGAHPCAVACLSACRQPRHLRPGACSRSKEPARMAVGQQVAAHEGGPDRATTT